MGLPDRTCRTMPRWTPLAAMIVRALTSRSGHRGLGISPS